MFAESGTDIDASKYVSKLLKRAVKQLPGAKSEPEKDAKDSEQTKTIYAKLIKMLKTLSGLLEASVSSRGQRDKGRMVELSSVTSEILSALDDLSVEFLSAPQVSSLKKTLEMTYRIFSVFKDI